MRQAITSLAVLVLLQLNTQQPILAENNVAKSDTTVANFVSKPVQPQFVDRSKEAQAAHEQDVAKENARVAAIQAQEQAKASQAVQQTTPTQTAVTTPVNTSGMPSGVEQLRQCESGGNYATNTGNGYYGAYQYDLGTWANFMGYPRPDLAPPEVQDAKFLQTYLARGASPWPVCGRYLH